MTVRIATAGALGRMGQAVAAAVAARTDAVLVARTDRPGAQDPAGGELVSAEAALSLADAIVDFSTPEASAALALGAARLGTPPALVIGSTGFDAQTDGAVRAAARHVAVVRSGNFSLGVNLLLGLVARAAASLPAADFDIEVLEAHHRRKVDAPSGTALMLADAAAAGRGAPLDAVLAPPRHGITGPRPEGAVGMAVLRGGGVVGDHSVLFVGEHETVTLSHHAADRSLFATGALAAALWAAGRPPGLYDMQDVLGLR